MFRGIIVGTGTQNKMHICDLSSSAHSCSLRQCKELHDNLMFKGSAGEGRGWIFEKVFSRDVNQMHCNLSPAQRDADSKRDSMRFSPGMDAARP